MCYGLVEVVIFSLVIDIVVGGKRSSCQLLVFSQKYELMSARDTHFRLTRTAENGTTSVISANVTFANMSDVSGGTTDGSAISVEMRFNGAPYLGDAWASAPTAYSVTNNLTNVTNSNTDASADSGAAYSGTLTAAAGYEMASVVITMGGVDITSTAYDDSDGSISIASVTGNIVITASAVEE